MKFYNREKEMELLGNLKGKARIAIIGRRRIGKTRLAEEFYKGGLITLFISAEKTEKETVSDWIKEYSNIYIPPVETFKDVLEYLFSKQEKGVFIDEIQNSLKINKSFIFDLQRLIDKYKPALIVSGSFISVMKKLIENYKSPLFGRFDIVIKLKELDFPTVAEICRDLGLDFKTAIRLYSIFGGVPKYYELIEKMKKFDEDKFVLDMFVYYPRPLYEEVRTMLKEEFGGEYKIFFGILSAISQGNNRLGEISGFVGREQTKITKYVSLLSRDFEIIMRKEPVVYGKKGIYEINSNITAFWFANIWEHQALLERMEEKQLAELVSKSLDIYIGRVFERVVIELITLERISLPFKYEQIGRQWGKIEGKPKQENEYEIDIVALNERTKEILFAECKWQDNVDAGKLLSEMKEKAEYVKWNNENRKAHYAIFARSFKDKIKPADAMLFDLTELEKLCKK